MLQNPKTACMRGTSQLYPAMASGPTCSKGPDLRPYFDVCFDQTEELFVIPFEDIERAAVNQAGKSNAATVKNKDSIVENFLKELIPGLITDGRDIYRLTKDLGIRGKMYFKTINGKKYIVFKGHAGLRKIFTGTIYSTQNTKVVKFGIGQPATGKSLIKVTGVTIAFVNAWDIAEFFLNGGSSWEELAGKLLENNVKAVIGAVLTSLTMAGIAAVTGIVIAPTLGIAALTAVVGVAIGVGLELLDNEAGITEAIKDWVQKTAPLFQQTWSKTVEGLEKGYGIVEAEVKETVEEVSTLAEQQYENFQTGRRYVSDQIAQGWDRWFQTLMANVPAY